ncbi:ABC transporter permease subunit [Shigella flexneri]
MIITVCRSLKSNYPIPAAMIGLSLNTAAYAAETLRAAISSIDKGQWEAGASIGMTRWQTMRRQSCRRLRALRCRR